MVSGFLVGHFKLLPEGASEALSRFVFVIALPALIFTSLSSITLAEFFNWRYIAVLGGGMLAMFCIGMAVARFMFPGSLTAISLHGLTTMYSSTAYIGLPLILTIFGDEGKVPGIIGAIITGLVFSPLAILLAEFDRDRAVLFQLCHPCSRYCPGPPLSRLLQGSRFPLQAWLYRSRLQLSSNCSVALLFPVPCSPPGFLSLLVRFAARRSKSAGWYSPS